MSPTATSAPRLTVPPLSESQRHDQILRSLESEDEVLVKTLAETFGVSEVTIRRDLEQLSDRRLLRRTRGGAVPRMGAQEGDFEMRLRARPEAKRAIAAAAADMVEDGDAIALDCSTTCYQLALALRRRRRLVIVTNGLRTAELLGEQEGFTVVLVGGTIRRESWSLVGRLGLMMPKARLRRGFFGAAALSVDDGLLELSLEEAAAKRRLAESCRETFGLVDSSKFCRFGLYPFAGASDLTGLITDEEAEAEAEGAWRALGVDMRRVPVSAGAGPEGER